MTALLPATRHPTRWWPRMRACSSGTPGRRSLSMKVHARVSLQVTNMAFSIAVSVYAKCRGVISWACNYLTIRAVDALRSLWAETSTRMLQGTG